MFFEIDRLVLSEVLEIGELTETFKSIQRSRNHVDGLLAIAQGFFQIFEVDALDPLISRVVRLHGFAFGLEVTIQGGVRSVA